MVSFLKARRGLKGAIIDSQTMLLTVQWNPLSRPNFTRNQNFFDTFYMALSANFFHKTGQSSHSEYKCLY